MKNYYIILSRSNTIVALLVRFFTHKFYSHASISFQPDLKEFYSFGRKNPRIMLPAGFICEGVDTGYFGLWPKTQIAVLEGQLTEEKFELLQEHLQEFKDNSEKYKYNLIGLALGYLKIPWHRKWHYTCSGFVAYIFRDILIFDRHYTLVQPEHFFKQNLKTIYKGTAGEYNYEEF